MERQSKMLVVLTISLVAVFDDRAVTYGQECIAPPPCECSASSLDCAERHLSKFPVLAAGQQFDYLHFRGNEIQSIGDDSFAGLRPLNNTMAIFLDNNQLNYISPAAFRGLENVSVSLHLNDNNLTKLPKALVHLKHIKALEMWGITSFDPEVLTVIGKSLEELDTGFVGRWPDQLNLATQLRRLSLSYSYIDAFPISNKTRIFRALRSFDISESIVNGTIDIICQLSVLERLAVYSVKRLSDTPVLAPCPNSIDSLTSLAVVNSSVSNVTDFLSSFPFLSAISIIETGLQQVNLPSLTHIEHLDLSSNKLENIPTADGEWLRLTRMHMAKNLVQAIHAYDLRPFPNLRQLYLGNNPIDRIESGAFLHNKALTFVDLSNTKITSIPVMPKPFRQLSLYLVDSPIECSCAMKWMDPWPNEGSVRGTCANRFMRIDDFMNTDLRQCQGPAIIG